MTIAHRPLRLPLLWLCSLIFISLAGCQQLKRPFSDAPQMTDAEIVHVARTLNQGEIDTSKPAVEKPLTLKSGSLRKGWFLITKRKSRTWSEKLAKLD